jgi:membrane protein required for colicin V production
VPWCNTRDRVRLLHSDLATKGGSARAWGKSIAVATSLNWFDYAIIAVVALSALISLIRGFVREALSLATWILAFWLALTFFRELAIHLEPWITALSLRLGTAFAILLLLTLMLGGVVGFMAGQLVDKTGLSGTDRLLGVFFGVARGVLVIAVFVLLAGLTPFPADPWWQQSVLVPYFQEIAEWLKGLLPADLAGRFNTL